MNVFRRRDSSRRAVVASPVRIGASRQTIEVTAPQVFRDSPRAMFEEFARRLASSPLIGSIELDRPLGRVVVQFDGSRATAAEALEAMARILSNRDAALQIAPRGYAIDDAVQRDLPTNGSYGALPLAESVPTLAGPRPFVRTGLRRAANLAAAGGCFVLSFVGLVTPGIPTVPFVLATSCFLVRSSPALDARLKRSRLFGPMLRDWEQYGGIRLGTKVKIVILTATIMAVTIVIGGLSWPILLVACGMGALGTGLLLRLPTVPAQAPA